MKALMPSWVLLALCAACPAQGADATLAARVQARSGWVSYHVPMAADAGVPCCYNLRGTQAARRGCDLDGGDGSVSTNDGALAPHGAAEDLAVYLHVSGGSIDKVRAYGASCPVRSATPISTLAAVDPAASVALLAQRTGGAAAAMRGQGQDEPLAAIAFHRDGSATEALREFSGPSHGADLRESALFWLGQARGAAGADIVERAATTDPDAGMRAHAVFVLSQTRGGDPYARVRAIGRSDGSAHVRSQALFWMAQMHDARAQADIVAALRQPGSEEEGEQAVFALTQLGDGMADRALVDVLRGDFPRATKQRALFWLGQSGSDLALQYFDEALGVSSAKR